MHVNGQWRTPKRRDVIFSSVKHNYRPSFSSASIRFSSSGRSNSYFEKAGVINLCSAFASLLGVIEQEYGRGAKTRPCKFISDQSVTVSMQPGTYILISIDIDGDVLPCFPTYCFPWHPPFRDIFQDRDEINGPSADTTFTISLKPS